MATALLRELTELATGFGSWLEAQPGRETVVIDHVEHASAGWSNETVLVSLGDGERLVVRLPPLMPSFPGDALPVEAGVMAALSPSAVPVPDPVLYVRDGRWMGSPFLVMPFVEGHVPGQAPAFDPFVGEGTDDVRRHLYESFLAVLAEIHTVDWRERGLARLLRGGSRHKDDLEAELGWWEHYVEWSSGDRPFPALSDALAWCRDHLPTQTPPPSLLWGDPRLGNLVVDDNRDIVAVLDWEMASIGPAELDLGWALALEWSTAELTGRRVPGFLAHDEAVTRYEAALGRPVADLQWFEIFALARSLAISNHQARAAQAAGVDYTMGADEHNPMASLVAKRIEAAR